MKTFYIFLSLFFFSLVAFSQTTVFFDKDWNEVSKKEDASYYRIEKIVEISLSDAEKAKLTESAEGVKKTNGLLDL